MGSADAYRALWNEFDRHHVTETPLRAQTHDECDTRNVARPRARRRTREARWPSRPGPMSLPRPTATFDERVPERRSVNGQGSRVHNDRYHAPDLRTLTFVRLLQLGDTLDVGGSGVDARLTLDLHLRQYADPVKEGGRV